MAKATTVMVLAAALAVLLLASSSASVAMAAASASPDRQAAEGGSCAGANDEDECMARRTLAAHTDYIYTQDHHN